MKIDYLSLPTTTNYYTFYYLRLPLPCFAAALFFFFFFLFYFFIFFKIYFYCDLCAFNCVLQILTNKIDATPLSASAICCPQSAVALLLDITLQHNTTMQQPLLVFPTTQQCNNHSLFSPLAGLLVDQQELSFFWVWFF